MSLTTRNSLKKPEFSDTFPDFITEYQENLDDIDALCANSNWAAVTSPTVNDDVDGGYVVGSLWVDVSGHTVFLCENNANGAAIWRQIWPPKSADVSGYIDHGTQLTGLTDDDHTNYILAAGTRAFSAGVLADQISTPANPASGKNKLYFKSDNKLYTLTSAGVETVAGLGIASPVQGNIIYHNGTDWVALAPGTATQVLQTGGTGANPSWANSSSFWTPMPGTPTRVDDNTFEITDTGDTNSYRLLFTKGTIFRWEKSGGGFQTAMALSASYGTNKCTIEIIGNNLGAGFTNMKYCVHRAKEDVFIVPGTLPGNTATVDISKTIYANYDMLIFSALVRYKTAATTTGGVWDINDDGTSIFTTKPSIAAGATIGTDTICNCVLTEATTVVAKDSAVTLDYDSGHATTPGADAYVTIWYMPEAWRYSV